MIIFLLLVTIAGWLGSALVVAMQFAAIANVGWAIFWGLVSLFVPLAVLVLVSQDFVGGYLLILVVVVDMAATVWAMVSLLTAASWLFGWALLAALGWIVVWGICVLVLCNLV